MKDTESVQAVMKLYDWVDERLNACTVAAEQSTNRIDHSAWIDMQGCFNKVRKKMETLFPWLKKLPNSEENREHGL